MIARVSWPLWLAPITFILAPELLLISDEGAGTIALVVAATAIALVGVQSATAGWLLRPLIMPLRILLYANFALLMVALRQDSGVMMGVAVAVVVATAAATLVLGERAEEQAAVVAEG